MTGAAGYAGRHLQQNDYYAEGERVKGAWYGNGAQQLGLEGEVQPEQFEAIRQGLDPDTGEFLRQRHSADRIAQDGTTQSHARSLYDFTFSAPKSVSVLAVVGGDERLVHAHDRAVEQALKEMESYAASRVRRDGANENRVTGSLVGATYRHDSSRELDPQLHTHAVAANLTYDGIEGKWKALQASQIYTRRAYLTEVYWNSLARQVQALGYEIENRRDARGKDIGFEVKGVSEELAGKYSQRSQQRDRAIESFTHENGRTPTDNEVAVLVRESRSDKLKEISTAEVRERQQSRLTLEEAHALRDLRLRALHIWQEREPRVGQDRAGESLTYAKEHLFERVSVARDYEVMTEALRHGRGQLEVNRLRGAIEIEVVNGSLIRYGSEVATRESLEREKAMIKAIDLSIDKYPRLAGDYHFEPSEHLRPEQRAAVKFVLDSTDLAVNIQGAAGTGKTALLQELREGIRQSNRDVLAVAPTMSAVEELQRVGFQDAVTVERLLQDEQVQDTLRGRVLIVDEASMVSGQKMAEVVNLAHDRFARIVFSGDTRQIHSVEASDALRILEQESKLRSISLTQVQRQRVDAYREAIEQLRADPHRGFERLERMGAIREVAYNERAKAVAQAYAQAQKSHDGPGKSRSVLVVSATHHDIENITEAIRENRKAAGELGRETTLTRHLPLNWTEAQKGDCAELQGRPSTGVPPGGEGRCQKRIARSSARRGKSRDCEGQPRRGAHDRRQASEGIFGTRTTVDQRGRKRSAPTHGQPARTGLPRDERGTGYGTRSRPRRTHRTARRPHLAGELPAVHARIRHHRTPQPRQDRRRRDHLGGPDEEGVVLRGRLAWPRRADRDYSGQRKDCAILIAQSDSRQSATELVQKSRENRNESTCPWYPPTIRNRGEPEGATRSRVTDTASHRKGRLLRIGVGISKFLGPLGGAHGHLHSRRRAAANPPTRRPRNHQPSQNRFVKQSTPEFSRTPGKEKKRELEEEIAENEGFGFGF